MLNVISGIFSEGAPPVSPTSYESIATTVVGSGGSATITFSSIPSTFKHLQIRGIARSDRAVGGEGAWAYFNNDTSVTTYAVHGLYGDGATAAAYAIPTPNSGGAQVGMVTGANAGASQFGAFSIDILDYTSTNKNKVTRSLTGHDQNGTGGTMRLISSVWLNTAAVTSIKLDTQGGGNFVQYSSFALYGIKG
jgi:hypothetical protein